jgi:hypothetical protein
MIFKEIKPISIISSPPPPFPQKKGKFYKENNKTKEFDRIWLYNAVTPNPITEFYMSNLFIGKCHIK